MGAVVRGTFQCAFPPCHVALTHDVLASLQMITVTAILISEWTLLFNRTVANFFLQFKDGRRYSLNFQVSILSRFISRYL